MPPSPLTTPGLRGWLCLRVGVVAAAIAAPAVLVLPAAATAPGEREAVAASTSTPGDGSLDAAFRAAAREFDVPRDLLVAVAYGETRLDGHDGEPSVDRGFGVMHLVDNPLVDTLGRAARLSGVPARVLRHDQGQNVRGGAAVLRGLADRMRLGAAGRQDLGAWYPVVARYSNASDDRVARVYADTVYQLLRSGVRARTPRGEPVVVAARVITPERGKYVEVPVLGAAPSLAGQSRRSAGARRSHARTTPSADYGRAHWVAAHSRNYSDYSRTRGDIDYVVLHTTQGSYTGAVSWFQNPAARVSAHYVIRSSDGDVTQMVRDSDVAWHAGNWTYNLRSIGIEHEGWVDGPAWYTDAMYRSSAALVRAITNKYGIPKNRAHILGHSGVPGATHTDPGPNWNWKYYMRLVRQGTVGQDPVRPWRALVDNSYTKRFVAGRAWETSGWSPGRFGRDYSYARPSARGSGAAWFRFAVPATDRYAVYVRHPANPGYSARARVRVRTGFGLRTFFVDQRSNGGRWVKLGGVRLSKGDRKVVGITRSSGPGYVIADAVRLVRQ